MTLHHEDTGGSGRAVVLIHGFPFSSAMWAPQLEALAKKGYRAIAPDLRGHGRSPAGDGLFTMDLFADDVLALLDRLSVRSAVLCGLSMGGYVALRAAEKAPDRVEALVLCDTRAEADGNPAKAQRVLAMKAVADKGVAAFAEDFAKKLFAPATLAADAPCVARVKTIMKANPELGVRGALLALAARPDATAFLPSIEVPTLILVGEHDAVTPPALSEAMKKAISGAELHVIPGAGHLSSVEAPDAFNARLLAFLERLPR